MVHQWSISMKEFFWPCWQCFLSIRPVAFYTRGSWIKTTRGAVNRLKTVVALRNIISLWQYTFFPRVHNCFQTVSNSWTVNPWERFMFVTSIPNFWECVTYICHLTAKHHTLPPYIPMQIRPQFLTPYWLPAFTIPKWISVSTSTLDDVVLALYQHLYCNGSNEDHWRLVGSWDDP